MPSGLFPRSPSIGPQKSEGGRASLYSDGVPTELVALDLDDTGDRPGDLGTLVPPQVTQGTPVSVEESKQLQLDRERREDEEKQRVEEFLESEATLFRTEDRDTPACCSAQL